MLFCFFFRQKTAYDMRISDWSSDLCSSDLRVGADPHRDAVVGAGDPARRARGGGGDPGGRAGPGGEHRVAARVGQSVVEGKKVSDSVDPGGRRINKQNLMQNRMMIEAAKAV